VSNTLNECVGAGARVPGALQIDRLGRGMDWSTTEGKRGGDKEEEEEEETRRRRRGLGRACSPRLRTMGGMRRVQLVREGGTRRVQLVREGGGGAPARRA
jgi:hypothetical protein